AVAEILCQTILVPVADYSLAFGYRTTDANGKDNETLAYKTFKMEKIDGVVVANEQASLEDTKPLAADQTKLNLADGTAYTLNVASTLNDIGESRYVYVRPAAGTTRYNLVCSKVYDTGLNNVYDSGDKVATVGDSTGKDNGITSITGAQHFVNYDQTDEYTTKIRIEYVLRGRWSDYQARNMRKANGGNLYQWNNTTKLFDNEITALTDKDAANWSNVITDAGNPAGHTYEYRKVINAFTKLSNIDWENIRTVFSTGDLTSGTNIVVGEIYLGTNTHPSNNPEDISDGKYKWETFVADYLEGADNKKQVTTNELGNRLKIVDNNNDGVAEYVLKTIYTVGIITANNNIDIANLNLADGDAVNEVTASTPVINDGEGELAAGNVVIYAKIDGNARAQLAATETAKINTVNRADLTATAEDGTTWKESWVHTHSTYLHSYVSGIYPNTTYTLYFDNYGNLAAYTEGENGGFVLITDGWYRSALNGGEYAVQAYIDGALKTVELTNGGSMFVNNNSSVNNWGMLKRDFGRYTINNEGSTTSTGQIHTIVGTLEGGILTPVDKTYKYSKNMVMLDMVNNAVPGRDGASANVYTTDYADGTAYKAAGTANVTVNALSNTTYYYVFKQGNTTAVRSYTGYGSIPAINNMYIEDVYAVGSLARNAYGQEYYTADVVVVELNSRYDGAMLNAEQVFIPDLAEVTDMVGIGGICNVMMIRGNGAYESVRVNMSKSSLRHYDEASNSENMTKTHAGLYTMTLDEGSTDTYVIKPMSNEQIRANGYMTGYVYKSYNTLDNDYAVVQMKSFGTGNFVPVDPNNMPQLIQSKRVVDTSKTYTLGYDSLYNAKLEESTPANVLSQAGDSAFRDVEESGLNERWDGVANSGNFTNPSLNEVLVRYDGSNVVWAVSFREYRTTDPARRDWAQTVWYSNLVSTEPYDSGITFWGVSNSDAADTNADARNITISHAQALLGQANNMVVDFGDKLNSATSWSLTGGSIIGSITNMTQLAAYNTITNAQETYTLTINRTNGTTETYILVKLAAETNAYLKINNDKLAGIAGTPIALSVVNDSVTPSTATLTLTGTDTWLVEDFIAKFQIVNSLDGSKNPTGTVVPGSKVVWTFWTVGANQTYTVKADNQGNADPTDLANLKNAAVHYMHAFGAISAQVYNEDGIADGNLTEVVTTDASALALAKKEALAKAEEYWNSLTDTQKADPDVKHLGWHRFDCR
ncbi:MAG: hypothetical protein HFF66_12105, partial [Oscillospiraceae bacterium]|nr:hypothetical protein [Oscillospiraceae bacterium]